MFSKRAVMWLLLLGCLFVLLTLPRFNRRDLGPWPPSGDNIVLLGDAPRYIGMVEDFRGDPLTFPQRSPRSPFTYRPLVPLLASVLPFSPMTSLNIINLAAIVTAMVFVYAILFQCGFRLRWRILGCLMFIFSLPTHFYIANGYVDAVLVSCITAGAYFILTKRWAWLALLVFAGAFVKETVVLLIPPLAVYLFFSRKLLTKEGLVLPVSVVLYAAGYYLARHAIPGQPTYGWFPSMEYLSANIHRVSSWKSYAIGVGAQGVVAVFIFRYTGTRWFHERLPETAMFITGCLMAIALSGYAVISAFADGRYIWASYPFSIPLAIMVLTEAWEHFQRALGVDQLLKSV